MQLGDIYNMESKWLAAADLQNRKHKVVIDQIEVVEFNQDGKKEKKIGVYLRDKKKGIMLNKTNAKIVAAQYGGNTDEWIGKEITIFPTTTTFGKDTVPCIRVEMPMQEADPDDIIPF